MQPFDAWPIRILPNYRWRSGICREPTGDIWEPSKTHPATVPVPLPVVMVRVDGPFTALDRKLWLLLLHNAWDELDKLDNDKPYHEISVVGTAAAVSPVRPH